MMEVSKSIFLIRRGASVKEFSATQMFIILSIVIVYTVFTSWLSIKLRSKTNEQFMTAARALPASVIGVLLMSEFIGTPSTFGTAQSAFSSGMGASWAILSAAISFILFGLIMARKLYGSGEFTISGIIAQKYGNSTRLVVSFIMIYALFVVNVSNYVSGAAALSMLLKISIPMAALITAIVSTFYYTFGGLKGVAYVSIFHGAMKYIGVIIVFIVAYSLSGGFSAVAHHLPQYYFTWDGKIGGTTIFAWIIANTGAIFSTQYIVQAISAAKNPEAAKKSSIYAALLCIPIALMAAFIGIASKYLFPKLPSIDAFPIYLQHMNPVLTGIVATALVASVFVNVSTVALGITALIIKDFYLPYFKHDSKKEFQMTRIVSLVLGFLPLIFVFFVPQILKLQMFTRGLRTSVAMVAVAAFYLPFFKSNRGATAGLVVSTILTTAWFFMGNPYGIDNTYIAVVTPFIVMVIDRLIFRHNKSEAVTQTN